MRGRVAVVRLMANGIVIGERLRGEESGSWYGAGFGPGADGGDVFCAGDAERLSGGDFGEEDFG